MYCFVIRLWGWVGLLLDLAGREGDLISDRTTVLNRHLGV